MNSLLARHVLEEIEKIGVSEICICPGGRNAPFVAALRFFTKVTQYHLFEERSAAFFALGRAKALDKPVVVLTTSGTAAAELLPATMEAYYSGVSLLLITADRPRRFRGTGAPQSADQVGLFGKYAIFSEDLAMRETCNIKQWNLSGPAHINVCFEEPLLEG